LTTETAQAKTEVLSVEQGLCKSTPHAKMHGHSREGMNKQVQAAAAKNAHGGQV